MHIPVLLQECIEAMPLRKRMVIVDATVNGGGHSEAIAQKYGVDVRIVGIDLDADALERSKKRLQGHKADFIPVLDSYKNIKAITERLSIPHVDAVLFDLGLSSDQYGSGRGFTFQHDEPLMMTFKKDPGEQDLTARMIVNEWEETSLAAIFWGFGEERKAKRIAQAIVAYRAHTPIETTFQLVDIVQSVVGKGRGRIHPATKVFQALRIAVNGELTNLPEGLRDAREILAPGGRLIVITFHSLEDRIVKRYFKECKSYGDTILTKKPIIPSDEEVSRNPRSRSAKLRILEKTHE